MKKLLMTMLVAICPLATNPMLPRLVAKKLTQSSRTFSTGFRSYISDLVYNEKPIIRNALGQVIIGIPVGWFGATIGGIYGTGIGFVIGVAPTYILENSNALETSTKMGTLIGGTTGGWLTASIVTGPRGAIACGAATALLLAHKEWNSLSEAQKQKNT